MPESLPQSDELLSAYIDGELTEAERAQVEAWLADDPRAQSLLEELQGVSAAVKSLPQAKLSTDLTKTILSKVGGDGASHDREATHDAAPTLPDREPQRRFTGRGLWWSAAAIAAAIAIALYVPQDAQQDQAPVAHQGPRDRVAGELAAPKADPLAGDGSPSERVASPEADRFDFTDSPAPTTSSPADDAPLLARSGPTPPPPGPTSEAPADEPTGALAPPAADKELADMELADDASPTQFLVVWVDVPAQTLERRAIDQVFTSNNIAVDTTSDTWQVAAEPVRQHVASRVASNRSELAFSRSDADAAETTSADTPFEAATQIADQGEAILVEATWEQVSETLKQLQADPQNFGSVTIETVAQPADNENRQSAEKLEKEAADAPLDPPAPATVEPQQPLRQRSADPQPTVEPPLPPAPAPETDRAIRSAPPREAPPETPPEGRHSVGRDRLEEGAPPEASELRSLGRARRLELVPRSQGDASASEGQAPGYAYGGAAGDERTNRSREGGQPSQARTPGTPAAGAEHSTQKGEAKAAPGPPSVQVLFVLRTRPPEIASEAAPPPAPAPAAAPE